MIGRFSRKDVSAELLRRSDFQRTIIAGLFALAAFLAAGRPGLPSVTADLLALISVGLNGVPIIVGAVKGLLRKRVNVDELVGLAIVACLIQGEYLSAAVVGFVMTLGALLEEATSESARKAVRTLVNLSPPNAWVMIDGEFKETPVERIRKGDRLLLKPGERISVDAVVMEGISAVDESALTGESVPVEKHAGDSLRAGTLNLNGVLEAEAAKVGEDTTLAKVIRLVADAEQYRPQSVRMIDRYARWFTPTIIGCAAAAWWLSGEAQRAVTVLIVGCPCALILAAPTATVAAVGRAARKGVLIKGGRYLEKAAAVRAVLFDKTGTLTKGRPKVEEMHCAEGCGVDELLSLAAAAERHCTHPLAGAVIKAAHYARVAVVKAEQVFNEIGLGVRACVGGSSVEVCGVTGGGLSSLPVPLRRYAEILQDRGVTPLAVFRDRCALGVMGISDEIRQEAPAAVQGLRDLGISRLAMLSGDHENSARRVAASVGIPGVWASLKPEGKLEVIRNIQAENLPVLFVGDGINDGPALAVADVGVAMGARGTDVALETADVVLARDDLSMLPFLIRLGKRMNLVIRFNLVFGLLFNAGSVLAGGWGLLTPVGAALLHNVGSILVVLSSASLAFFNTESRGVRA